MHFVNRLSITGPNLFSTSSTFQSISSSSTSTTNEGVEAKYIREEVIPEFFKAYWNRRMAYDKKNQKALVETTVEIACKVGGAEIIRKIIDGLKDEVENIRKLTMETIEKIIATLGVADID